MAQILGNSCELRVIAAYCALALSPTTPIVEKPMLCRSIILYIKKCIIAAVSNLLCITVKETKNIFGSELIGWAAMQTCLLLSQGWTVDSNRSFSAYERLS